MSQAHASLEPLSLLLLLRSLQALLLFYETPVLLLAGLSGTLVLEMNVLCAALNKIMIIERKYQKNTLNRLNLPAVV